MYITINQKVKNNKWVRIFVNKQRSIINRHNVMNMNNVMNNVMLE